ncbi:MerR family DNA-binding transcriptional regulator [Endozoicomonas sp. ONNA2]|uniref:MerR family DNA-binding transcriptional regulator n=1 Tax=Endozoicomonas sp. ONNA2 TaxID=2828741 RepID=UPI0035A0F0DA
MKKRYSISQAADHSGVSLSTLRRWEACGKLVPERRGTGCVEGWGKSRQAGGGPVVSPLDFGTFRKL